MPTSRAFVGRTIVVLGLWALGSTGSVAADAAPSTSTPLKVCMLSGSEEYHSDESLAAYQNYLESRYPVRCTLLRARGVDELPGLEALDDCDVALFFTRRLKVDGADLERVKKYVLAGKPVVGVRTASHGFQNWLEFDKLVLGGNYHGHYSHDKTVKATVVADAQGHPVVAGVGTIKSRGGLYKTSPLASDVTVLMTGAPEGTDPVTWVREFRGGRVFYTSLGAPGDFEHAGFLRLLTNALFWAARREAPAEPAAPEPSARVKREGTLRLTLRSRVQPFKGRDEWEEVAVVKELPVAETAVLICDMWDRHWCDGATRRCGEIAERMAPVVDAARARGVQIIHAPSDTTGFYAGSPQRLRMQRAAEAPAPRLVELSDPPLPIDDSDGGCDTGQQSYEAWTRQHPAIPIAEPDGISDDGREVSNYMAQEGIKNLLIMGVHTNMCVLGRSFAIREMTRRGVACVLVRDLTDTMYDPHDPPHVPHDRGTELVVEHIEKYWAPSVTSSELLQGLPREPIPLAAARHATRRVGAARRDACGDPVRLDIPLIRRRLRGLKGFFPARRLPIAGRRAQDVAGRERRVPPASTLDEDAMDRRILVVDDSELVCQQLSQLLVAPGRRIKVAHDGTTALEWLVEENFSLVLTDLCLPGIGGLDLIHEIRKRKLPVTAIVMTGHGSIDSAVAAMKLGAYDYLLKPIDTFRLELLVRQALEDRRLQDEIEELRQGLRKRYAYHNLVGKSPRMAEVFQRVERVAASSCTVLITGETGTGKELVAQAIHYSDATRDGPLVAVNCAALPEPLLESEFFGHERGAFTGADRQRKGRFEQARGGTLLLDEIGELPVGMQAKLLRVLQDGTFERVGGTEVIRADCRILASTNLDLAEAVRAGRFREDLFYRLNVVTIEMPPLRDRPGDIPLLVEHVLQQLQQRRLPAKSVSRATLSRLARYDWPGNVRELEHVIEQMVVTTPGAVIEPENLPAQIVSTREEPFSLDFDLHRPLQAITDELTERIERAYLQRVLERFRGRIDRCAEHCGLSRRSISEKLRRYQIDKADFKPGAARRPARTLALGESA